MSLPIEQQTDQQFIRIPYELIRKQFKLRRKQLEHDLTIALSQIIHINSQEKATLALDKIKQIKEQLNVNTASQNKYKSSLLHRLERGECSHETKLQRAIIDNLLREGYVSSAEKLVKSYKIENLTDVEKELIIEANSILKDLKSKSVKLALIWCKQNESKLKKLQSTFLNNLVFQEYIEYLKQDQWKAVEYLQNFSNLLQQESIQKACGCLVFAKQIKQPSNYSQFFQDSQWESLIRQFKKELYEVYCYPMESPLLGAIKCGISTLKTQYCDQLEHQKSIRCPICSVQMQELSKELLTTQKLGSTWICRISGELMDENNPPMMLPNHQVYSQKALQQMSEQMKEEVYCPITKEKFKFNQCIRVYLT